ncbi:MAG TPA: S-methyl-5-thioribose kinase [Dongiaceae bacterium]|nr:S-methyl-5-thioribose kinase [Dongiaceae bacterium]
MSLETPPGYRPLDEQSLPAWLAGLPEAASRLGGGPAEWKTAEVGDGNLNLVFLVEGPAGGVCVKQALPYVRLVGEGWPMTLKRAFFEHEYMRVQRPHVGRLIPEVYHYEPQLYAVVMELLKPHIIMRHGMIQGQRYPAFAGHIVEYMAQTLFMTSDFALPAGEKKALTAVFCDNTELCKITEDLIFTEPYRIAERNRWTSPQLDKIAGEFRADVALKLAISRLKHKFLTSAEALIHGDLHTGSVMATESDTRVIDAEFAFVGPMGFDVGAVLGNLLLSYFSQDGHAAEGSSRAAYQDWILETLESVWNGFSNRFLALWRGEAAKGDAYPRELFAEGSAAAALETERLAVMARLYVDSIGFAAAKMIRRILGLAHVIDLEKIADPDRRALCETRALRLARELMVNRRRFDSIAAVADAAQTVRHEIKKL